MNTNCKTLHQNEIQTVGINTSQDLDIEKRFKAIALKIGRATKTGSRSFWLFTKKILLTLEHWSAEGARIHNAQRTALDDRYASHAYHIRMI